MAQITKKEIEKLAELTRVTIAPDQIDSVIAQLTDVLSYAERVVQAAASTEYEMIKNVNVVRDDIVIPTDVNPILKQAPDGQENYFVVPKFLDN